MPPETIQLDPKLEELLREIAADPESGLLRVPRPKVLPTLFERGAAVGPNAPFLTKAERELLRTRRGELAWVLKHAIYEKVLDAKSGTLFVQEYSETDAARRRESRRQLGDGLAKIRASSQFGLESTDSDLVTNILTKHIAGRTHGSTPLAATAFRLHPCDEFRVLASIELAQKNDLRSALCILTDVLSTPQPGPLEACVWTNLARVYACIGDPHREHEARIRACECDPTNVLGWMHRVISEVQIGSVEGIKSSTIALQMLSFGGPLADQFVDTMRDRRRRNIWTPTNASRAVLTSGVDVGDFARMVFNDAA